MSEDEITYAKAGVDRTQEEKAVQSILKIIKTTHNQSISLEGHFAGSIPFGNHLLSLATDGVGTKVLLAQEYSRYDTIGIDCVAMNVNDLICIGSIPVAFVDYIAIRQPDKEVITSIVEGLAKGCLAAGIPLIGGETAVLPEVITAIANDNGFDVAGTALGIHEKDKTIDGSLIQPGDKILGITSSGIHSNGLTLARKVVKDEVYRKKLLTPTRIYVEAIKQVLNRDYNAVHGICHITGGGFTNLSRLGKFRYEITLNEIPEIFTHIQEQAKHSDFELYNTFNCGIGMCVITPPKYCNDILNDLNTFFPTSIIGMVKQGNGVTVNDTTLPVS